MTDGLAALIEALDDGTDDSARRITAEIITRHPAFARKLLYPVIRSAEGWRDITTVPVRPGEVYRFAQRELPKPILVEALDPGPGSRD